MAGRPRRRAMIAELTKRCIEEYEDGDRHLDYVAEWVEDGKTIKELAADMSETIPRSDELGVVEVNGAWITRHLIEKYGKPVYDQRMREARSIGSYAMVEDAREIAEETRADKEQIALSKLRIDQRHWTAERFNKELGTRNLDINANVNVGQLHLDALRARQVARVTARMLPTSENESVEDIAPAPAFISTGAEPFIPVPSQSVIAGVIAPVVDES